MPSDLLNQLPQTRAQLRTATDNVDPVLWDTIVEITPETTTAKHQQKQLTSHIRNQHTNTFTDALDARGMAVHLSTSGTGAGAWLHTPTQEIAPLTNEEFSTAAKMRLDKPHTTQPAPCNRTSTNSTCTHTNNTHLDHAHTCQYGPHRVRRHNKLRDALAHLIHKITGHQPLIEQVINLDPPGPNSPRHSDDLTP